ncbi:Rrf2 family transcriptional regulator [bacterium]|nr:Rrf2 family transcriptional regulator [bacterium]
MALSQKCQYALRAVLELARQRDQRPLRIGDIATAQSIPTRFLEVILNELRQGGFVESRRGKEGGYLLARNPAQLTVGEVIRFVEGPLRPADPQDPAGHGALAMNELWLNAEKALATVYDQTTFAGLIARDTQLRGAQANDFTI